VNQDWLRKNVPNFISAQQWPSNSPDANPMDFSIWAVLEARVCTKKYGSLDSLKSALRREWERISPDYLRAACESFIDRLDRIIKARGGYIEN